MRQQSKARNWNDEWYPYLSGVAHNVLSGYHCKRAIDIDDLISHAWLNSVRRIDKKAPLAVMGGAARRSMVQYLYGKRRKGIKRLSERVSVVSLNELERNFCAPEPRYTYDDIDQLRCRLNKLSPRTRAIVNLRLHGYSNKAVAAILHVSSTRIWQILKREVISI